jgi:hypothetical protein
MPIVRARRVIVGILAAALAGCGGLAGLKSDPSQAVDLSGSWVLDRAASDDPQKVLDKLRPKVDSSHPGDASPDDGVGPTGDDTGQSGGQPPNGSPRGGRRGRSQRSEGDAPAPTVYRGSDAITHNPVIRMLMSDLARGEHLTVRQAPDEFSLDYGITVRTFTPGGKSVIGADWGVADQVSGWKGKEYVIETKPQSGVAAVEKYGLSPDGRHLIEQLRLGGSGYPVAELKRVYDHTDKPLTRAVPSNE